MKTVHISHNESGLHHATLTAKNGYKFTFSIKRLSEDLKSKLFGLGGLIELTLSEAKEIHSVMISKVIKPDNVSLHYLFN
jgi:hypothetical protein